MLTDAREIARRVEAVRQARIAAYRRGCCAPTADELTRALGDTDGMDSITRKRASRGAYRSRSPRSRLGDGKGV